MADSLQVSGHDLRGYVDYLRDLGVFDLYRTCGPSGSEQLAAWLAALQRPGAAQAAPVASPRSSAAGVRQSPATGTNVLTPFERASQRVSSVSTAVRADVPSQPLARGNDAVAQESIFSSEMPAPPSFNVLAPLPSRPVPAAERAGALEKLRGEIGDCTRCPLAYAGRHTIVFADGDPNARLMFVGEGPGADEDQTGVPFVGKAGQLLNNMIQAMGLQRNAVYIANIVKCRPPKNRVPEPVEANTCSQFLTRQIDIVQPEVIVALGSTAATYLLGVKQSLSSLRGNWFDVRGSKCAVTYHPAFLLRDPRQKGEAWKDLQRVMVELNLKPRARG